jgi:hypothetical protein
MWKFVLIEDTCQTQLMLETAISRGQQDVSAEHIDFLLNINKAYYFKIILACLDIPVRFHCTFVFDQETICSSAICWVLAWFVLINHVSCSPCMLFQRCEKKKKNSKGSFFSSYFISYFSLPYKKYLYTDFFNHSTKLVSNHGGVVVCGKLVML